MQLSQKEIENWVRANFDVKDGSKELRICNPFQELETGNPDTKYHMTVNPVKGLVHDWRPSHQNHDGPFIKFVMDYLKCSYKIAVQNIKQAKHNNITSLLSEESIEQEKIATYNIELPSGSKDFSDNPTSTTEKMVFNYLKSRCISADKIKHWNIMYGVSKVVFPYIEYGEVVYWQTRDIDSKRFEFPSSDSGILKTQFLYGWDKVDYKSEMMITESLFGAISIGDNGLASGGATLDKKQISRLKVFSPNKIILAPDNDDAGTISLHKNWDKLHGVYGDIIWYCQPPFLKDKDGKTIKDWNDFHILCMFHPNLVPTKYANNDSCVKEYISNNMKKLTKTEVIRLRLATKNKANQNIGLLKILKGK